MAICINGAYATVHYFQNDAGDMWLSYHEKNQKEVTFISGGNVWNPDVRAVIRLKYAFLCIREFYDTYKRPSCIQWQYNFQFADIIDITKI